MTPPRTAAPTYSKMMCLPACDSESSGDNSVELISTAVKLLLDAIKHRY